MTDSKELEIKNTMQFLRDNLFTHYDNLGTNLFKVGLNRLRDMVDVDRYLAFVRTLEKRVYNKKRDTITFMIDAKNGVLQAKDRDNYYFLPLNENNIQEVPIDIDEWNEVDFYNAFDEDETKEFWESVVDLPEFYQLNNLEA